MHHIHERFTQKFPKSSIFFPREQPMYMDVTLSLEATQDQNQEEAKQHEDFYDEQQEEIAPAAALLLDRDRRRHHGNQGEEALAAVVVAHHGAEEEEWEHMFDKVVTPSDVGKLNRLVVPKQHAERCFPAPAAGMELCFQDRAGTPWRFRYSYWGSSQSYVMTKGWSRFVRAAGLAAGDTVSFSRSCAAGGGGSRYFIDCHHRQRPHRRRERDSTFGAAAVPAALRLFRRVQTVASGASSATMVFDTVPHVVAGHQVEVGPTSPRSFRLFGVNVECGGDEAAAVLEVGDVEEEHHA